MTVKNWSRYKQSLSKAWRIEKEERDKERERERERERDVKTFSLMNN